MPDELREQIPIIYNLFEKSNIPLLILDSYEADDIIGTFSKKQEDKNIHTYIVSGDKDLMQLVNDNTSVYSLGNKFKPTTIYNNQKVLDKWNLPPDKIIDYLALVGDTSDNIPGVAGVGPKTAVKLINEFENVENIYKSLDEIKNPNLKTKLINNKENAFLSKELVTINLNVPIEIDFEKMKYQNIDFESLRMELNKIEIYNFDSNLNKYIENETGIESFETVSEKVNYILVDDDKKINSMIKTICKSDVLSLDLETTSLDPMKAEIVGLALSVKENEAFYVPFISPNELFAIQPKVIFDKLYPIFESEIKIIGQNLKYDCLILKRFNVNINKIAFDTYIVESLISPERNSYKLDNLAIDYLNYKMQPIEDLIGEVKNEQILMSQVPIDKICFYACEDVDVVLKIYNKQRHIIDEKKLDNIFYNIEMPLLKTLIDMEFNGMFINKKKIKTLSEELKKKIILISEKIFSYSGKEFNINSPKQLAEVLFDDLNLKQVKKEVPHLMYSMY